MGVSIALFTRDLRVNDNPVLAAAAEAGRVVPLFVLDPVAVRGSGPGRRAFLAACLADLDAQLRRLGGRLVVRRGDVAAQVCRLAGQVGADRVHVAADVSGYARARQRRLRSDLAGQRRELVVHEQVHTVVAPGLLVPAGADHYAVFTAYWRRWTQAPRRRLVPPPARLRLPGVAPDTADLDPGRLPELPAAGVTGGLPGGERAARRRMAGWLAGGLADYADARDRLACDGTSRLSPYLHFGCLSAAELAAAAGDGSEEFVRQLAWRDFHHQVLAARPGAARNDYRTRGDRWRDDEQALAAWQQGQTGYPLVDAGMRQLRAEGWMHNRARMVTGSFLAKTLYLDWRLGAAHFAHHLLDADVANNCLNWQWVAGTGTDTRPNRVLNPVRQAQRHDPDGDYVRRWVPELADLAAPQIHQPWRHRTAYPAPLVDLAEANARFRELRRS